MTTAYRPPPRPLHRLARFAAMTTSLASVMAAVATAETPTATRIAIDPTRTHQIMEGFGASGSWWAQCVGGWPAETRATVVRALFDSQRGIGLTIYRYHVGAGAGREIRDPWRRAESFETDPGNYDWSRDADAVRMLRDVHAAGVTNIVFVAYSPPPRLTRSGKVSGGEGGASNLAPGGAPAYAAYLADVVRHFQAEERIPVAALSPLNEPQWNWGEHRTQEGCHYTPDEAATLVDAVANALRARRLAVRIDTPEGGNWSDQTLAYVDRLFENERLRGALDGICAHSYWSDDRQRARFAAAFRARYPGKVLRMTEWCEMKHGRRTDMESGLVLANTLHQDLTIADVVSWQFWLAVSRYDYADGLICADLNARTVSPTKRLWVLGQYSRFIRPGSIRLETECADGTLAACAFRRPSDEAVVLVVINKGDDKTTARLELPDATRYRRAEVFQTNDTDNLRRLYSGPPPATARFAPKSVTTVIWAR